MLAKIRRMHIREKLSIREIARRTNLSRNTVRQWLKSPEMSEPKYPERRVVSVVDPYVDQLRSWLETDSPAAGHSGWWPILRKVTRCCLMRTLGRSRLSAVSPGAASTTI
jgi:transposase